MITIKMDTPSLPFNVPLLIKESITALDEINKETHGLLDDTKKDFSDRSQFEFEEKRSVTPQEASASTSTDNENWIRLNNGTDDHIVGAGGKLMSFLPEYTPKTRPFTPRSRPGGGRGNPQIARGPWRVRGIEPRGFIITVYTLMRGKFHKRMDQAFRNALKVR